MSDDKPSLFDQLTRITGEIAGQTLDAAKATRPRGPCPQREKARKIERRARSEACGF